MTVISDEFMREAISKTKPYCVVILKAGPRHREPGVEPVIWEHGRRNFELRAAGRLSIICPIRDGTEVCGIGIFSTSPEETKRIMDHDPGVKAGVFVYELHPSRSFPGDALPG